MTLIPMRLIFERRVLFSRLLSLDVCSLVQQLSLTLMFILNKFDLTAVGSRNMHRRLSILKGFWRGMHDLVMFSNMVPDFYAGF